MERPIPVLRILLFAVLVVAAISLLTPPTLLEQNPNWACENATKHNLELRETLCAPEWWIGR